MEMSPKKPRAAVLPPPEYTAPKQRLNKPIQKLFWPWQFCPALLASMRMKSRMDSTDRPRGGISPRSPKADRAYSYGVLEGIVEGVFRWHGADGAVFGVRSSDVGPARTGCGCRGWCRWSRSFASGARSSFSVVASSLGRLRTVRHGLEGKDARRHGLLLTPVLLSTYYPMRGTAWM